MTRPPKSEPGLAFSLLSKVADQATECDGPPDDATSETPGRERKRTAEELWAALMRDAMEEEIDRVIALSPEEIEQDLREAGFDVDRLQAVGSDMYQELLSFLGQPADPPTVPTSSPFPPTQPASPEKDEHAPSAEPRIEEKLG
jgi:hypothetical protein